MVPYHIPRTKSSSHSPWGWFHHQYEFQWSRYPTPSAIHDNTWPFFEGKWGKNSQPMGYVENFSQLKKRNGGNQVGGNTLKLKVQRPINRRKCHWNPGKGDNPSTTILYEIEKYSFDFCHGLWFWKNTCSQKKSLQKSLLVFNKRCPPFKSISWRIQLLQRLVVVGLHPHGTPKWMFGRWFSFSNKWFSGSMLVFRG